jgi:hypothetical protein
MVKTLVKTRFAKLRNQTNLYTYLLIPPGFPIHSPIKSGTSFGKTPHYPIDPGFFTPGRIIKMGCAPFGITQGRPV